MSSQRSTTQCRISQSTADVLEAERIDRQAVTLHAHESPCGHVDRDTSVTIPVEEIVQQLTDRDVAVRRCNYCGRHLRDRHQNGGENDG
jgi:hypothetical protein